MNKQTVIPHTDKCECAHCALKNDAPNIIRSSISFRKSSLVALHEVVALEKINNQWFVFVEIRWTHDNGMKETADRIYKLAEWRELVEAGLNASKQ
jgi:hypothetical protein